MHYVALIGEDEREVEITETTPNNYRLMINGRELNLDARAVSDTTLSLLNGEQAYNVESESSPEGGENILVRGHLINVEVLDLRSMRLRKAQIEAHGPEGPMTLRAPMPGKVVGVLAENGQEVEEGEGLVIIEAMKMENELRAPRSGIVQGLKVKEGDTVEGNMTLCVVE